MRTMSLKLVVFCVFAASIQLQADTVAYWRFDVGPANTIVQTETNDYTFSADLPDVSGNGNHMSAWNDTPNSTSLWFRDNLPFSAVTQTGQANLFSLQNYGSRGCTFTCSSDSNPSGIDAESITPEKFTVEAVFNPEDTQDPVSSTGIGTIVNRDAYGLTSEAPNASAFSLRVREDFSVEAYFMDVSGYVHTVRSEANAVVGFDRSAGSTGTTGTWYHAAAVSDGSTFTLYLTNLTNGGETEVVDELDLTSTGSSDTALTTASNLRSVWHGGSWVVFRGLNNAGHGYRYQGFIDEVRLSNDALKPLSFLCNAGSTAWNPIPEDGSIEVGTSEGTTVSVDLEWNTGLAEDPADANELISDPNVVKFYLYMSADQNVSSDTELYFVDDISVSGSSNQTTVSSLSTDGQYLWRIDQAVDVGGGTASGTDDPNTIIGNVWSFETLPTNYAPVVEAGDTVYTWLVDGTVDVQLTPTITDEDSYTVLWEEAVDDPNVVINDPTSETTTVTIQTTGVQTLQLTANDGSLSASDTIEIRVYSNPCSAAKGVPGYTAYAGDLDDDCDVDLDDFIIIAADWLQSNALANPLP